MADLEGDGRTDALVADKKGGPYKWWRYDSPDAGWVEEKEEFEHGSEDEGPSQVLSDPDLAVFLADMTGDGLPDVLCLRPNEVAYWPALGRGKFGKKMVLPSPSIAADVDPSRVRLLDVDGLGCTDILYIGDKTATLYLNQCGNRLVEGPTFSVDNPDDLRLSCLTRLDGRMTGSFAFRKDGKDEPIEVIDFSDPDDPLRPWLLTTDTNGMGLETTVTYAPSTKFFLQDRSWKTRLPYCVAVVESVEVQDHIAGVRARTGYRYRHGCWDPLERRFNGFAYVEQVDDESFEKGANNTAHQTFDTEHRTPPVLTKTWFHPGVRFPSGKTTDAFRDEYNTFDGAAAKLPEPKLPKEAVATLAGRVLRTEVYALDGTLASGRPVTVTEHAYALIDKAQKGDSLYLIEEQSLAYTYERHEDPDPRLVHNAVLDVDKFGNALKTATVAYPRRKPQEAAEARTEIRLTQTKVTNVDEDDQYLLGAPIDARTFAVADQEANPLAPFSAGQLRMLGGTHELSAGKTLYWNDTVDAAATEGVVGKTGLVHSTQTCAFTEDEVRTAFGVHAETALEKLAEGAYVKNESAFWIPSGHAVLDPAKFFQPDKTVDPFGQETELEYDDDVYFVTKTTDPKGNTTQTEYDHRALAPAVVTDPNRATTTSSYNALGLLTSRAVDDAETEEEKKQGDSVEDPTVVYEHHLHAFEKNGKPTRRETKLKLFHRRKKFRLSVEYYDGSGGVVQSKVRDASGKFRTSGRTVVNGKGLPVLEFDPVFTSSAGFSNAGGKLAATLRYDALGRLVRTDYRDGTHDRVEIGAWQTKTFDRNDTVAQSEWLTAREKLKEGDPERRAAALALKHANTPTVTKLDTLGRTHAVVEHLVDEETDTFLTTRTNYDARGNPFEVIDPRGNLAETRTYGHAGTVLSTSSEDAGQSASLSTIDGGLLYAVREGVEYWCTHDELRRPVGDFIRNGNEVNVTTLRIYVDDVSHGSCSALPSCKGSLSYHRRRLLRVYDGGGELTIHEYDFKGNPKTVTRRLPLDPKTRPEWSALKNAFETAAEPLKALDLAANQLLPPHHFTTNTEYDAQNRATRVETPSGAVQRSEYREEGLLSKVERAPASLGGDEEFKTVHRAEDYDEHGRPLEVHRGKSVTRYTYDPDTDRLQKLVTRASGKTLQSLHYTYDPVGNITEIHDHAQKPVKHANEDVDPRQRFKYDSLYRLTEATGREHAGQASTASSPADPPPHRIDDPNNPKLLRSYRQNYHYDATGNLTKLTHTLSKSFSSENFTRENTFSATGNRLAATQVGKEPAVEIPHDARGRMTAMTHLDTMKWDELDNLQSVERGTTRVFFQYVDGQRIRKFVEKGGGITEERLYLGAEEWFTKTTAGSVVEETVTEHAGGALIETKRIKDGKEIPEETRTPLFRFQLGNNLGSVSLELDEHAKVISYEEHHPYGTTSFRATRLDVDVPPNRYRYTAMERDDETSLAYHGARYYAPWLGRWTAADPIGLGDGLNRYAYCRGSPVTLVDPTGTFGVGAAIRAASTVNTRKHQLARAIGYRQGLVSSTTDAAEVDRLNGEIQTFQARLDRLYSAESKRKAARAAAKRRARAATDAKLQAAIEAGERMDSVVAGIDEPAAIAGSTRDTAPTAAEVAATEAHDAAVLKTRGHRVLDIVGLAPGGWGVAADAINVIWYGEEGDWVNAGISAVSVFGGDLAKGKKLADGVVQMLSGNAKLSTRAARVGVGAPAAGGGGPLKNRSGDLDEAARLARGVDPFAAHRNPRSLQDQVALDAAKRGEGEVIIRNLGGKNRKHGLPPAPFDGMDKMQVKVTSASGKTSVVHYVRDPKTGNLWDFKFAKHSTD